MAFEGARLNRVVLTGTGLFTPSGSVTNDELVESLTTATLRWNEEHAAEIARGEFLAREVPTSKFILRASGVGHRYLIDRDGVLDPTRLRPRLRKRSEDELSLQAEMGLAAAQDALAQAGRKASDVDAVIVGCSNLQRAYPALAIEIQAALGARGFAYDMSVACSSASFAIQNAVDALKTGRGKAEEKSRINDDRININIYIYMKLDMI